MAKRLTVIISQSSSRHSQAADAEERLLSELIMAPGIDATLVGSLDNVQPDSTDYLCLSGFAGQTLAVVSSLSVEQVAQQWARLQLNGKVVRMGQPGVAGQRRVIHFPLSSDTPGMLSELRQLLADQAVATVQVLMPLGSVPLGSVPLANPRRLPLVSASAQPLADESSGPPPAAVGQQALPRQAPASRVPASPVAASPVPASPVTASPANQSADERAGEWPDLDRLVDDLDALDL